MLILEGFSEMRFFRHLTNHVFSSSEFPKYISNEGHPFIQNVQNLMKISKVQLNIVRKFFIF